MTQAIDPTLRFEFRILDAGGECLVSDWTSIPGAGSIDIHGGCKTVDIHVASGLRATKRYLAKAEARRITEAEDEMEEEANA